MDPILQGDDGFCNDTAKRRLRASKTRSCKARADFGGRGVAVNIGPSKSANNAVRNGIYMRGRRASKIRSGKARADFGGRGVAVYISPSKSVNNAVRSGFWASS